MDKVDKVLLGVTTALVVGGVVLGVWGPQLDPTLCATPPEVVEWSLADSDAEDLLEGAQFITMDPDQGKALLGATEFPFLDAAADVVVFRPADPALMVMVIPMTDDGCVIHMDTGAPVADADWQKGLSMVTPKFLFDRMLETIQHGEQEPATQEEEPDVSAPGNAI